MEFSELIRQRYSVRAYRNDPVEAEKLQQILEAARLAPTACKNGVDDGQGEKRKSILT